MNAVRRRLAAAWRLRAARRAIVRRSRPGRPEAFATVVALIGTQLAIVAAGTYGVVYVLLWWAGR